MKVGNKVFYKNEPVLYFDSLKTSSMESQATTVYAQGGRGNARLIAWEGERTVTFTMEDALISAEGFAILTGAGLVNAKEKDIIVHRTEITNKVSVDNDCVEIELKEIPYIKAGNILDFYYDLITTGNKPENNKSYYKENKELYTNNDFLNARIQMQTSSTLLYTSSEGGDPVSITELYNPEMVYYKKVIKNGASSYESVSEETLKDEGFKFLRTARKIYEKKSLNEENQKQRANDDEDFIYVMLLDDNGEVISEPYIASETAISSNIIFLYQNETDNMFNNNKQPQESEYPGTFSEN